MIRRIVEDAHDRIVSSLWWLGRPMAVQDRAALREKARVDAHPVVAVVEERMRDLRLSPVSHHVKGCRANWIEQADETGMVTFCGRSRTGDLVFYLIDLMEDVR